MKGIFVIAIAEDLHHAIAGKAHLAAALGFGTSAGFLDRLIAFVLPRQWVHAPDLSFRFNALEPDLPIAVGEPVAHPHHAIEGLALAALYAQHLAGMGHAADAGEPRAFGRDVHGAGNLHHRTAVVVAGVDLYRQRNASALFASVSHGIVWG